MRDVAKATAAGFPRQESGACCGRGVNPLTYGIDAFKHVLLRDGAPPLGPEFPLSLDLLVVTAISAVMLTLAALSFRKKE